MSTATMSSSSTITLPLSIAALSITHPPSSSNNDGHGGHSSSTNSSPLLQHQHTAFTGPMATAAETRLTSTSAVVTACSTPPAAMYTSNSSHVNNNSTSDTSGHVDYASSGRDCTLNTTN